jgi:uncharacterized protein YbjT (DUF2867 family)
MTDTKIIAVAGATGSQGGGLVRAIMDDPNSPFTARALTRDVNSDKAKALAALGAEVVAADVDDGDSMKRAFAGAYGAFCVTFFWEHFSPEKELAHAKGMAEAAKHAGLQHVIWSTLDDTRILVPLDDDRMPTLMDRYKVPHFDAKGEANSFFTDIGVPTTFLATSFYWDNLIHFGMGPKKGPDGKLAITFPMGTKKLPGIAAEDIGGCAYGIFKHGSTLIGKTVGIAGEHLTGAEMAAALTKAMGECSTTTCRPKCTVASGSRGRKISGTCSNTSGISRRSIAVYATSCTVGRSIPGFRRLRCGSSGTRTGSRSNSRRTLTVYRPSPIEIPTDSTG